MVSKKIFINVAIPLLLSLPLSGATLNLLPASTVSPPPGDHVDLYLFPFVLVEPSNPIVRMSISYFAENAGPTNHAIVSGTPLFDGSQVTSIDVTTQTLELYEADIEFSVLVTDVSGPEPWGFAAVHGEINDASLTILDWTAHYQDGSQRSSRGGIIPEPSSSILSVMACFVFAVRRRR